MFEDENTFDQIKKFFLLLLVAFLIMLERAWVATVLWWMLGQPYTHLALPFSVAMVGSLIFSLVSYSAEEYKNLPTSTLKTLTKMEIVHPIALLTLGALLHLFM